MKYDARRVLSRIMLTSGLALLAIWALAQLHSEIGSSIALAQIRSSSTGNPASLTADGASVDTSLWSEKRIADFKEALGLRSDPPIAALEIPRLGLQAPVFRGTDDINLNRGVGWIAGTAELGTSGNAGIAGHRDGFFRGLKDIAVGDVIELRMPDGEQKYVVRDVKIVQPTEVSVLAPANEATITLVTCYPFYFVGSAPERFIVRAVRSQDESANAQNEVEEKQGKQLVNRKGD